MDILGCCASGDWVIDDDDGGASVIMYSVRRHHQPWQQIMVLKSSGLEGSRKLGI